MNQKWKQFSSYDPQTKEFLDDTRSKAKEFQCVREYGISEFICDLYGQLLRLKSEKRLNKTLRKLNRATNVKSGASRMLGLVRRASDPDWDTRRASYTAGLLDSALKAGTPLTKIEEFRLEYARSRSRKE
ncbi:hypothetical protein ACKWRH_10595 [Bradyrhizobium sp. Pa8]|uniref:hypothetical protein n=1 Tax=Bradyrhizobium sp. Pa8 TaxID=3386552 RepID=UPI00403F67DE